MHSSTIEHCTAQHSSESESIGGYSIDVNMTKYYSITLFLDCKLKEKSKSKILKGNKYFLDNEEFDKDVIVKY